MFIGLDLGTSGVRAIIMQQDGTVLHSAEAPTPVAHLHPGWSEQDPADWTMATRKAIAQLRDAVPGAVAQLRGIGLSGQMHGATMLDRDGNVLRPCMLWNDTRAQAQADHLNGLEGYQQINGNIIFPGFTAPKVGWVRDNEPETHAQIARVLLPKDYLSFWLTGRAASDMSDSSGTGWMDVGGRCWSDRLLELDGMRRDQMPDLIEGNDIVGTLRPELAGELGLPAGVQVIAGGGDNAAAACGVGALAEGDGFVSLGTSGVLLAARDGFLPNPASAVHTFCHAIPDTWYQMGVNLAATDCLNWLSGITGQSQPDLTAALGGSITAPGTLRFLPYLSGERTPHNDSAVRGAFVNIDIATDTRDLTRAVLEGVSFAMCDSLIALRSCGARLDRVLGIGGGTKSRYWCELMATVLDLPLDLPAQGELGAALGAARLAISGVTGAKPGDFMTKPEIAETIQPRADLRAAYQDAHANFVASFPALKAMPPALKAMP